MPVLTIALMGFLAFSGGPAAAPDASSLATLEVAELSTEKLAVAEPSPLLMAETEEAYTVKLTSYNAVPEQTDANPNETASGVSTNPEVVAARSIDLAAALPYGTVIAIEREGSDTGSCRFSKVEHLIGYRVIADSMHTRKRNQIDVELDPSDTIVVDGKEVNPSLALGLCSGVTIRVVGRLKLADIPATQEELRRMVEGDALALNR